MVKLCGNPDSYSIDRVMERNFPNLGNFLLELNNDLHELGISPLDTHYREINTSLKNWIESRNPDYLDYMVLYTAENNIPITPIMHRALTIAAEQRLIRAKEIKAHYRSKSVITKKDGALDNAMRHMMRLIVFCGLNHDDASLIAAAYWKRRFSHITSRPANTFRKDYGTWSKKNAQFIKGIKEEYPDGWSEEEIQAYVNQPAFDQSNLEEIDKREFR